LLPQVLRILNDTPSDTGYSAYQIVFGRDRGLAHTPIPIDNPCKDAAAFIHDVRETELKVAKISNEIQKRRAESTNKGRREPPPLKVGAKVWYRPETQPGHDKTDTYWIGPGTVTTRIGEHSYEIQVNPKMKREAHISQLRPHIYDEYNEEPFPLYYFSEKAQEVTITTDHWEVERLLKHRVNAQGVTEFLVKWAGCGHDANSWEPTLNLITPNEIYMAYCGMNGLRVDLMSEWEARGPHTQP
jgi:hypothetical protein